MNDDTAQYLRDYICQLGKVCKPDDVYGFLSNWHHNSYETMLGALADLNACLDLTGAYMLRNNPATTGVGTLTGSVVVISANPGFSSAANARETQYRRGSEQANAEFCRNVFQRLYQLCRDRPDHPRLRLSPYWSAVLKLMDLCKGRESAGSTDALWTRAAQVNEVGGIDLLPFHSPKDGVTPFLTDPQAAPLLHEIAVATLKMALRLKPRILLVTSLQGAQLMSRLMREIRHYRPLIQGQEPGAAAPRADCPRPWHRLQVFAHEPAGMDEPIVVTLGYQVFSGSVRAQQIDYCPERFAQVLKDPMKFAGRMNDREAFAAFLNGCE